MSWNVHLPKAEWYTPEHATARGELGTAISLEMLINELKDQKEISLDTETTGLNIVKDLPLFWSLAWGERRVCMSAATMPLFQDVFKMDNKRWIFANAKYDMHILANVGLRLAGECCDTAVMHALLYEESPHGLKDMAKQLLGWKWTDFKETFGIQQKGDSVGNALLRMEQENLPKLVEYASNDAYGTLKVYLKLKKELEETATYSFYQEEFKTMGDIFFKTEMPYTKVLWKCERNGVKINAEYLSSIEGPCRADIQSIEREIVKQAGRMINPNSPKQLQELFFGELKLRPVSYTKGGKSGVKTPSVDAAFLQHYAHDVPMAKLFLDHRELSKLLGTYIMGLQERMDPFHRIHTKFNQDVARTGRLSSSDPNLQNIPTAENDKYKLRGAFIPEEGNDLLVWDYEALEMRLLAAAAMEPAMIQIFLDKKDIHMGNAAMVFGRKVGITYEDIVDAKKTDKKVKDGVLPPEAMTDRMRLCLKFRSDIKTVAFGMNYGMKENKLARGMKCTKEEAVTIIKEYMDTYPAVTQFYQEAIEETRENGYSFTFIGRRRYHPEILSEREMERWGAERQAVNNQIQGTAADVVRFAMLLVDAACLEEKYGCKMLLQIHDELVFECPKESSAEAMKEIKQHMEHPFFTDLAVPLTVSGGKGDSWLTAK